MDPSRPSIDVTCGPGSSLEGHKLSFTAPTVALGRHPSNDVVFDANEDRMVSGRHAEIRVQENGVWLHDLGSSNGTFVNGTRIDGGVELRFGDRIVLGQDGATMQVYSPLMQQGAAPSPGPSRSSSDGPGHDTIIAMVSDAAAQERRRSRPLVLGLGFVVLLLLGGLTWGGVWLYQGGATDVVKTAAREEARLAARDEAKQTARGVARDEAALTARGVARDEAASTARGVAEQATKSAKEEVTKLSKSLDERIKAAGRGFDAVFPRIEKSVYPVLKRKKVSGKERTLAGGGTCWVVAPGVLATNAHVAKNHLPGVSTLIVRVGKPARELRIRRVKIHPGYASWSRVLGEYRPIDPVRLEFMRLIGACDVALMWVDEREAKYLGPPLPIAKPEALRSLARGTPAAFLGYPVEGSIVGALERSEATSDIGSISQVFDFFLEQNDGALEQLVTYNLKTAGGASGSPVFNLEGEVVAVHSAGNYKYVGPTRISQGSTAFGQRADLVQELLKDTAKRRMLTLETAWRRRFLSLWSKVRDSSPALNAMRGWRHFPKGKVSKLSLKRGSLGLGGKATATFTAKAGTSWSVVALVTGTQFGKLGLRGAVRAGAYSWVALAAGSGSGTKKVEVYRASGGPSRLQYELWLLVGR